MFDKRLKELRLQNGYTQKNLADLVGCDQSMIARWEKGECEPTASAIKNIALIFSVSADYLLGLED
ncbi:MAG: helix-turn-helix transcriptional regulator [Clostridia bacterium]|nr:helix-turn-helix transcriptional regulator [Clostridia bacterium]